MLRAGPAGPGTVPVPGMVPVRLGADAHGWRGVTPGSAGYPHVIMTLMHT
jgi:hypothetical protein